MTTPERDWWRTAVIYQVYVRSFGDADGDGVGDLAGVRRRLPYLADLGVDGLWLTPFYRSPMADHGYDVADYFDVDPTFGDLAGFDGLLADAHALGLKVIADVVPNHTSSEHEWFQEALASPPGSPARERYVFRDPKPDGSPPNNWRSVFGGSAWSWDRERRQCYLHLFAPEQPDLNWRNPVVHAFFEDVLAFWFDRGVDGFRIDVAHGLYKHPDLLDTPDLDAERRRRPGATEHLSSIGAGHLWDQPEVLDVYRRWRKLCEGYPDGRTLVGEVFLFDLDAIARYVGDDRLNQAFTFPLLGAPFDADRWRRVIELALDRMSPCTWVLSNHDVSRHATRYGGGERGRRRALAATVTMLALPGAAYLYQGDELGLEDAEVPPERRQDPIFKHTHGAHAGRDGCRAPIPWATDPPGYGFTTAPDAWLPFAPEPAARSVAAQAGVHGSTLEVTRSALRLRRGLVGDLRWVDAPDGCLAFARGDALCVLNAGDAPVPLPAGGRAVRLATAAEAAVATGGDLVLPADAAAWLW